MAFRIPLAVLFALIAAAVLCSIGCLVVVLGSMLDAEAHRNAETAVRGSLQHAAELIAAPFEQTVVLVRRAALSTARRGDRCDDGRTTAASMGPVIGEYLTTTSSRGPPIYALYQVFRVGGDNSTWSTCGCLLQPTRMCFFYRPSEWAFLNPTYPNVSGTTVIGADPNWNQTLTPFVAVPRATSIADKDGVWGLIDLFYDSIAKTTTAYITFTVPTLFDAQGRTILAETLDVSAELLSAKLKEVTLPDTEVTLVHALQKKLLATTYGVPLFNTTGSKTALWPMDATPSADLNGAVQRFSTHIAAGAVKKSTSRAQLIDHITVDIDGSGIYGHFPLISGTLHLSVVTVTKRHFFFKTMVRARLVAAGIGAACALLCLAVSLVIWGAIRRALMVLQQAMIPAAQLKMDPQEYAALGTSVIADVAALQDAFGVMNEKLHQAGAFLPQSVRAAWAIEDGDVGESFDDDEESHSAVSDQLAGHRHSDARETANTIRVSDSGAGKNRSFTPSVRSTSTGRSKGTGTVSVPAVTYRHGRVSIASAHFRRAKVAVLQLNLIGFHGAIENIGYTELERKAEFTTDVVAKCAARFKGVVDTFQGDRYTITFNAVTQCSAGSRKAVACALAVSGELQGRGDGCGFNVDVSAGVAVGAATVGDVGSSQMRRFGILGPVLAEATVLERLCRATVAATAVPRGEDAPAPAAKLHSPNSAGAITTSVKASPVAPCFVPETVFEDIGVHFAITAIDYVRLPGQSGPKLIGAVTNEHTTRDDEWLYVVGDHTKDPAAKALRAAVALDAGDDPQAALTAASQAECTGKHAARLKVLLQDRVAALALGPKGASRALGTYYDGAFLPQQDNV